MCGRFTLVKPENYLADIYGIESIGLSGHDWQARYNISPTQQIPVIIINPETNKKEIKLMTWGLSYDWTPKPLMNARKEKLFESKLWKGIILKHRCIIPASAFYEWQDVGKSKTQPWLISLKQKEIISFPGIWSITKNKKTGEKEPCCSIITTEANPLMRVIHNKGDNKYRQPGIIDDENIDSWLDPSMKDEKAILDLIRIATEEEMLAIKLATVGNDITRNPPIELKETETDTFELI